MRPTDEPGRLGERQPGLLGSRALAPLTVAAALLAGGALMLPRLAGREPPVQPPLEATPPPRPPRASASAPPPRPPPPAYVRDNPDSATACATGMALVDGVYCPFVAHRCQLFADEAADACRTFAPEVLCDGRLAHRRFCIDRYEYPNLEGVVPAVLADWNEAARACATEGKRLCAPEEWEFACEGTQMWPYPYGRERDATACHIDAKVDTEALAALGDPLRAPEERQRADGRLPSGARSRCVSPFGVYDLTGNVEEWVDNLQGTAGADPYRSTRKGGHYGPGAARCRTANTANPAGARSPLAGFRCCADARGPAAPAPPPAPGGSPRKHRMVEP